MSANQTNSPHLRPPRTAARSGAAGSRPARPTATSRAVQAGKPAGGHQPGSAGPDGWALALRVLAVAALVAITFALVRPHVPVDDAYITFRYSENFARGQGVVFNIGERVEGYSSLTWLLLLAAAAALRLPLPEVAMALGILCGIATVLVVGRGEGIIGHTAALLAAACLPFVYHVANGLETGLFALLITLLAGSRRWPLAPQAALAAALALTRPEGVLLVSLWCALWMLFRGGARSHWPVVVAAAAWAAWLGQLAWRMAYFGDWMPNAARAKLMPLAVAWPMGLRDLASFAWSVSGFGILLVLAGIAITRALRPRRQPPAEPGWTLRQALFLILASVVLAVGGGDSFPLWRFWVPLAPTFFLVAARGLWGSQQPVQRRMRLAHWAVVGVAIAAAWVPREGQLAKLAAEGNWVRHWRHVGERLRQTVPAGTSIALCPIGALPYASGLRTIDMLGLADAHIARVVPDGGYWYPGHQRHDGGYVLGRRPDVIVLGNAPVVPRPRPFSRAQLRRYEQDVARDPRFAKHYALWHLPLNGQGFAQLFVRRELLANLPGS